MSDERQLDRHVPPGRREVATLDRSDSEAGVSSRGVNPHYQTWPLVDESMGMVNISFIPVDADDAGRKNSAEWNRRGNKVREKENVIATGIILSSRD